MRRGFKCPLQAEGEWTLLSVLQKVVLSGSQKLKKVVKTITPIRFAVGVTARSGRGARLGFPPLR
ncbi:hypothetical protein [Thermococcus litoralis]|uniref:hypothetical protein n=1 Tax=Thermococcus litoralis TaxID=2265 RepID=UPI00117EE555|nr:hypothetical protein [Thermococcus litoralis]